MNTGTLPALRIVVLAAGYSTRLGKPKALSRVRGLSLLRRTIRTLSPFRKQARIIVVVPPRAASYAVGLGPYRRTVVFVANPRRATGMASSVRLGLARGWRSAGILLLPVDLVELERRDIARLIARWQGARRRVVARRVENLPGAPLILPRWLYPHGLDAAGDSGLRNLVRRLPHTMLTQVKLRSADCDIDTPRDLARARRRARPENARGVA